VTASGDALLRRISIERLAILVSSAAYGTVLVLATLSVIQSVHISVGYGAELVAGVGVATWVAHVYAELLGEHVHRQRLMHWDEAKAALLDGLPILCAPVLPALVLSLAKLDTVSEQSARVAAMLVGIAQLLAIGFVVGMVAPARRGALLIFGGITVAIGLAVVVLTTWLGH